jgi:LacI family transcriptional regulator
MKAPPKMQDVARASGYSRAAVSMALRGDPSIPEETRDRIQAVAQRIGYRANPLVAALMSLQRQRRPTTRNTTTVAFLTSHPADFPWRKQPVYQRMFAGAEQRAGEPGFRFEEFDLRARGMNAARARSIFEARHIHAVVAAPLPYGETRLDFDFGALAVIGLGLSVHEPRIERVSVDLFQSARCAVERCVALGYRRARLPPLMPARTTELAGALPAWLRTHKPDVVILGNAERELPDLIPADVGLVLLSVDQPDGKQSGIYEDHELLGRIAVEHLVAKLNQNILGPLPQARVQLVEGSWVAGKTAPGAGRRRS